MPFSRYLIWLVPVVLVRRLENTIIQFQGSSTIRIRNLLGLIHGRQYYQSIPNHNKTSKEKQCQSRIPPPPPITTKPSPSFALQSTRPYTHRNHAHRSPDFGCPHRSRLSDAAALPSATEGPPLTAILFKVKIFYHPLFEDRPACPKTVKDATPAAQLIPNPGRL